MKRPSLQGRAVSPFTQLDDQHQRESILRLSDSRFSDHAIATLTGMDVASVRRIIATRSIALLSKCEVLP